jgi:thiol-disulfide isomerase/thioredoxin
MRRVHLRTAAAFVTFILALGLAPWIRHSEAGSAAAPKFEVVTLGGEAYSKDSLKGQPALLVFWAPWCKVCQKELPLLAQYSTREKPAQLRILSIGFADLRGNVDGFVKAHPEAFAFPTAFDIDNDVAQAFKVTATPTLVLLDGQGNIVLTHRGAGLLKNVQFREFVSTLKG